MAQTGLALLRLTSKLADDIRHASVRGVKAVETAVSNLTANRIVTLDVDSSVIRIMEIRGKTVTRWASAALESAGEGGAPENALGAAVKRLMSLSGIKDKKVIVSMPGLYSTSRILEMTKPPAEVPLRDAVLEKARESLPLPMEKLYFSWQTLSTTDVGFYILAIGLRRDTVDSEVQSLKKEGINPYIAELRGMALARAVNKERALIINVETLSFDTVVVINGVPEVMNTSSWQAGNLTVEDRVEHLSRTLELVVGYYSMHNPDANLGSTTPLVITGKMSSDSALIEKLRTRLTNPIEPLAPALESPASFPISEYAVNIGLALKKVARAKIPGNGYSLLGFNLLPEVYRPWRPSAKQLYAFAILSIAVVVLFPLLQVTADAMGNTADLQSKYTTLNDQMQLRQLEIKKRQPLQNAVNEYQTIIGMNGYFIADIEAINKEAEKLNVQLKTITHEGTEVSISAEADDYTTFRKYLTALTETGRFASVKAPPEGFPFATKGPIILTRKTK